MNQRVQLLETDVDKMTKQLDIDQTSYEAYNTIREVLNKIETTLHQSSTQVDLIDSRSLSSSLSSKTAMVASSPPIQFEMIVNAFIKLVMNYPKEIILLGLIDIIPNLGESIISREILQWDILENPMKIIDLYVQWMSSLSVFEIQEEEVNELEDDLGQPKVLTKQILDDLKIKLNVLDENSKSIVQTAYDNLNQIIEKYSVPKLRRYLLNEWNVKNPGEVINCTNLMKGLKVLLFQPSKQIFLTFYRVFIVIKPMKN